MTRAVHALTVVEEAAPPGGLPQIAWEIGAVAAGIEKDFLAVGDCLIGAIGGKGGYVVRAAGTGTHRPMSRRSRGDGGARRRHAWPQSLAFSAATSSAEISPVVVTLPSLIFHSRNGPEMSPYLSKLTGPMTPS